MSVVRIEKSKDKPYVLLDITALNDARLSFRAKGLHTYLMSKPDDWQVYIEQLEQLSPCEGRDAIRMAMQELEEAGYLHRKKVRGDKGRMAGWDTTVYETPSLAQQKNQPQAQSKRRGRKTSVPPTTDLPTSAKPTSANPISAPTTDLPTSAKPQLLSIDLNQVLKEKDLKEEVKKERESTLARTRTPTPSPQAKEVLEHLNTVIQRRYANTAQIQTLLASGVSVEACRLVIDFGSAIFRYERPEWYAQYFDNVTPFRPGNFDKYRARAVEWERQGRAPYSQSPDAALYDMKAWVKAHEDQDRKDAEAHERH